MDRYKFVQEDELGGYLLNIEKNTIVCYCLTKRPDKKFSELHELVDIVNCSKNNEVVAKFKIVGADNVFFKGFSTLQDMHKYHDRHWSEIVLLEVLDNNALKTKNENIKGIRRQCK